LAGEPVDLSDRALFALHRPLGEWMGTQPWRMIEHGRKKYIWHLGDQPELYDLASDPLEMCNLASRPDSRDLVKDLHNRLTAFMRDKNDPLLPTAQSVHR
ncbi:MAG: hypothetical protein ACE360_05125, partial [Hyphomicrobiales bacterium]